MLAQHCLEESKYQNFRTGSVTQDSRPKCLREGDDAYHGNWINFLVWHHVRREQKCHRNPRFLPSVLKSRDVCWSYLQSAGRQTWSLYLPNPNPFSSSPHPKGSQNQDFASKQADDDIMHSSRAPLLPKGAICNWEWYTGWSKQRGVRFISL